MEGSGSGDAADDSGDDDEAAVDDLTTRQMHLEPPAPASTPATAPAAAPAPELAPAPAPAPAPRDSLPPLWADVAEPPLSFS